MNGHYIHLLSNHFPIVLLLAGFFVLTYGLLKHIKTIKQVGLMILLASSISTIPAYISGEEAEHAVEKYAGTSESSIEEHEEGAEFAFIFSDIVGVLSLLSLLLLQKDHKYSLWANRITWALSLFTISVMVRVGQTGGQIRRPELRANSTIDTTIIQNEKESDKDND